MAPKASCESIKDIVCSDHDFDILCEALLFTDLDDDLDGGLWTLFAPTDASFVEFLNREHLHSITDLGKTQLRDVLLYHAVPSKIDFDELDCGEEIEMASGECTRT